MYVKRQSQGPHSQILMTGGGGGGEGPTDFFGSEISAKSDSFGPMKDAGIFFGLRKRSKGYFWVCFKK